MADESKPRVVHGAIEVAAGKTSRGPAATNIGVQVDTETLDEEMGEATQTNSAFAFVPKVVDGKRAWSKEDLHRLGKRMTKDEWVLESFDATVSGPSQSSEEGVTVGFETSAGTVWAQDQGEAYGVVRPMDEPTATEPKGNETNEK